MPHDICNAPADLHSSAALAAWDDMIRAFLSHSTRTPEHLGTVLAAAPDFALGHAAKGLFSLMMGRRELAQVAAAALRDAQGAVRFRGGADARTRAWIMALDLWLQDMPGAAIGRLETVLRETPQDTLTAKLVHGMRFILGDCAGMRASLERILPAHGLDHPLRGYVLGCHAFALEETGDYAAAERAGLAGLELAPDDAWGLHAVAHVHDMTARPDRGIALIEQNCAAWDHCNNFRYHVWWHKALLHLDRGEHAVALELYDAQIRADKTDDYRDIANATSLLMRLELDGWPVGARWEELADLAQARAGDGMLVFADLHYMLALGAAGRPDAAAGMALHVTRHAKGSGDMGRRYADPGLAAMAGLHSFAEGRWDTAFLNLAAARRAMQSVGGSHAQRDVFERMTIDAGLRAGYHARTEDILAERTARRAGREDRFAATRRARLSEARRIPAQ